MGLALAMGHDDESKILAWPYERVLRWENFINSTAGHEGAD